MNRAIAANVWIYTSWNIGATGCHLNGKGDRNLNIHTCYYYYMNHMIEWNFNESEIGFDCEIFAFVKMYTPAPWCAFVLLCSRKYKFSAFIMLISIKRNHSTKFLPIHWFILLIVDFFVRLIMGNVTMRLSLTFCLRINDLQLILNDSIPWNAVHQGDSFWYMYIYRYVCIKKERIN